jgi:hypothetical protein
MCSAAQARYEGKVKTAEAGYDTAVEHAQKLLMEALDGLSAPS